MFGVKKLDIYIIRQFLALLMVTFFIPLFVIVMQFVWLRIDDMLGKGIPIDVMAKFLFYASLSSTPIALPLAILLAALMTFGNLGERLELIAMKTAGISLFRIMRPLWLLLGRFSTLITSYLLLRKGCGHLCFRSKTKLWR